MWENIFQTANEWDLIARKGLKMKKNKKKMKASLAVIMKIKLKLKQNDIGQSLHYGEPLFRQRLQ